VVIVFCHSKKGEGEGGPHSTSRKKLLSRGGGREKKGRLSNELEREGGRGKRLIIHGEERKKMVTKKGGISLSEEEQGELQKQKEGCAKGKCWSVGVGGKR